MGVSGIRQTVAAAAASALLVCLVAFTPAAAGPRERLERLQERERQVEDSQERLAAQGADMSAVIRELDEERALAEERLGAIDSRLSALDGRIAELTDGLASAQQELALVSERLEEIQARLDERRDLLQERAVSAYKYGPTVAVDSLLSARSFSDMLDRFSYYESAVEADSELIGDIEALESDTETRRDLVDIKTSQIAEDKLALERHRAEVAQIRDARARAVAAKRSAIAQKEALLEAIEGRQARLAAVERKIERDSADIEQLLAPDSSPFPSAPGARGPETGGQMMWPASGPVTSPYGYRIHPIFGYSKLHTGLDIGAAYGSAVWAAGDGEVAYVGTMSGYGNVVVIDHGGGVATTYNHLSGFYVSSGQQVSRGQQVAVVGCTGYCTGPHLHFEVRVNGSPVDPMPYLQ